jgi:hypothetical protein
LVGTDGGRTAWSELTLPCASLPVVPCVFCGSPKLTREHVWPDWLSRAAPAPKSHVWQIRRRTRHGPEREPSEDTWRAPAYTTRVRAVCGPCNHGWMSQLEGEVKPLLEPMLHGQTRILDQDRQALLATWAFKTTAMLEFTHPQERAIQSAETDWLYHHREPPQERTIIWIASYRGVERNSFYRHDVMRPGGVEPAEQTPRQNDAPLDPPVAYGVNFGVRHVAFQVFGTTEPNHVFRHVGFAAAAFEQIWPVRAAFTWPPTTQLDDRSLAPVLEMFPTAGVRR